MSADELAATRWLQEQLGEFSVNVMTGLLEAAANARFPLRTARLEGLKSLPRGQRLLTYLWKQSRKWSTLSVAQRHLILEAGEILGHMPLLTAANRAALDPEENRAVRNQAVGFVARLGRGEDLAALLAGLPKAESDNERATKAAVLIHTLRRNLLSAFEVHKRRPELNAIIDNTHLLGWEIASKLTEDEAFRILDDESSSELPTDWDERVLVGVRNEIAKSSAPSTNQRSAFMRALAKAAGENDWDAQRFFFAKILRGNPVLRQFAYEESLRLNDDDDDDVRLWIRPNLQPEDARWLVDLVEALGTPSLGPVADAFSTANGVPQHEREGLVTRLRLKAPSQIAEIEAHRAKAKAHDARIAEMESAKQKAKISLERATQETLARSFKTPAQRLHTLAWLCLSEQLRPNDVEGEFKDLPHELRSQVLQTISDLLVGVTPSPIERGNRIAGSVMHEADAFEAVVRDRASTWLTASLVTQWLPAVLRATTDAESAKSIDTCARSFPNEAVAAFLSAIGRELQDGQTAAFTAGRAPKELWEMGLADGLFQLLRTQTLSAESRAAHLQILGVNAAERAIDIAREWIMPDADPKLRAAAITLLLAAAPEDGMRLLEGAVASSGDVILLDIAPAFDRLSTLRIEPEGWVEPLRERLATLLLKNIPPSDREAGEVYWVTAADSLEHLRRDLLRTFFNPLTTSSRAAILRLAVHAPSLLDQLAQEEAEDRANETLAGTLAEASHRSPSNDGANGPPTPPNAGGREDNQGFPGRRLPLSDVLRVLNAPDYRLARTNGDLARVLVEVLNRIGDSLAHDLRLLFKQPGWKDHASEDVLQSYLRVRLNDLIPGRFVDREAWMPMNRRADLRVIAVNNRRLESRSTVQVELKWSDDRRAIATTASEQLGDRYLRPTGTSHGIYVIAWCGKARHKIASRQQMVSAVNADIEAFQASHPEHHIDLVVLDVLPPASALKPKAKKARAPPAKGVKRRGKVKSKTRGRSSTK